MAKISPQLKDEFYTIVEGSKTVEVDVKSDGKFLGRVCAPSGASVGKYEAVSFPNGKPEESLKNFKRKFTKIYRIRIIRSKRPFTIR